MADGSNLNFRRNTYSRPRSKHSLNCFKISLEIQVHIRQLGFIRELLSKLHLIVKIAIIGIFSVKFFDHMFPYALKICR